MVLFFEGKFRGDVVTLYEFREPRAAGWRYVYWQPLSPPNLYLILIPDINKASQWVSAKPEPKYEVLSAGLGKCFSLLFFLSFFPDVPSLGYKVSKPIPRFC